MKTLFIILLSVMTTTCEQSSIASIEYWTTTRGYYKHIELSAEGIVISNAREDKNPIQKKIKNREWMELSGLLTTDLMERLSALQPPSTESHSDGALSARLVVNNNNGKYETMDFDHGNPPSEIDEVVTRILALAQE